MQAVREDGFSYGSPLNPTVRPVEFFPLCIEGQGTAFEECSPDFIFWVVQLDRQNRALPGTFRFLHQLHSRLFRSSGSFLAVALEATADDIFPRRFASLAAGNHVVKTEMPEGQLHAAVLTRMVVAGEQVSAVETEGQLGDFVVAVQSDYPWNQNCKIDTADPLMVQLLLHFVGQGEFTDFQPAFKIVVRVVAVLDVDHLGKFPVKDDQCPAHRHDVNSHIKAVENKDTAIET